MNYGWFVIECKCSAVYESSFLQNVLRIHLVPIVLSNAIVSIARAATLSLDGATANPVIMVIGATKVYSAGNWSHFHFQTHISPVQCII